MPSPKAPSPIYQLKVTLIGIAPPIWRRIQVLSSIKLCCLHSAIQVVMGWTDSHLHQFEKDGKNWGVPEWDEFDELDLSDESKTQLAKSLKSEGDSMIYVYDFGDNWRHEVVLEKIIPVNDVVKTPVCLAGERRCPPEDVGGVSGYDDFLEVIFDPKHEEYDHYVRWAGGHFVDECDVKAVNETLSRMGVPGSIETAQVLFIDVVGYSKLPNDVQADPDRPAQAGNSGGTPTTTREASSNPSSLPRRDISL